MSRRCLSFWSISILPRNFQQAWLFYSFVTIWQRLMELSLFISEWILRDIFLLQKMEFWHFSKSFRWVWSLSYWIYFWKSSIFCSGLTWDLKRSSISNWLQWENTEFQYEFCRRNLRIQLFSTNLPFYRQKTLKWFKFSFGIKQYPISELFKCDWVKKMFCWVFRLKYVMVEIFYNFFMNFLSIFIILRTLCLKTAKKSQFIW